MASKISKTAKIFGLFIIQQKRAYMIIRYAGRSGCIFNSKEAKEFILEKVRQFRYLSVIIEAKGTDCK